MTADCPACGAEMAVDYEHRRYAEPPSEHCVCEECGARFEVESDADFTGDHWQDCSTPGRRVG